MKPQHTPGPWRVGQRHSGDKIEIRDTAGTLIGWAYGASSIVRLDPEANARLLAAAPELLAIVEAVADRPIRDDMICHVNQCSAQECSRCGPILAARELVARLNRSSEGDSQ